MGISLFGQSISSAIIYSEKLYNQRKYNEAIDLLNRTIENHTGESDFEIVEAKLWLARIHLHNKNAIKANKLYKESYHLAKALDHDSLLIQATKSCISMSGFYDKTDSLNYLIYELLENPKISYADSSDLYIELASYYEDRELIDSAIHFGTLAAVIDSLHQDSSSIPYTYYDLGNFYIAKYEYGKGISKILTGLEFLRGEKDYHKRNNMEVGLSNIYYDIGNIPKAEELAIEVVKRSKERGQNISLVNAYNTLGNCASYVNNHMAALNYYEKSDSANLAGFNNIWRSIRAKVSIVNQKIKLGYKVEPEEIDVIIKLSEESESDYIRNITSFLKLRTSGYSLDKFNEEYSRIYNECGAANNLKLQMSLLKIKREYYAKNSRYKEAFEISNLLDKRKRNIELNNNKYIIQDLEAKYKRKEQNFKITLLDEKNASQAIMLNKQKQLLLGGGIALVIISFLTFFLLRLYRRVKSHKEQIARNLKEKELLLREIHHRVKNNLQLVSSLLTLQGRSIDDESILQAINEGKSRVRSMALIHQDLYSNDSLMEIGVKKYLENLAHELFETYNINRDRIKLYMDIENVQIDVDTLIPLGLIINELFTNSLKYAWPHEQNGSLNIKLVGEDQWIKLNITDDGVGFDVDSVGESSFGSTLISALVEQLEGKMSIDTSDGTKILLRVPI